MAVRKKSEAKSAASTEADEDDEDYPLELLSFGTRLERELKKKLGDSYSQSEAARRTGVSQPTISNLIKKADRKHFRLSTALKIAKALDISLDVLLLDRPDPWRIAAQLRRGAGGQVVQGDQPPPAASPPKPRRKTAPQS